MLFFDRIDVSERIDFNQISASKKYDICHYWYFLNKGFTFQPNICNKCHDLLMMPMDLNAIAVLNIKSADYCCFISRISKNESINLIQNANSREKKGIL